MINNPMETVLNSPSLLDAGLFGLQTLLDDNLSWLNNSFGRVEVMEEYEPDQQVYQNATGNRGRRIVSPVVYVSGLNDKDYLKLFPDGHLGNFSYFYVEDGEERTTDNKGFIMAKFGLVFWFDMRTVYPSPFDWKLYNIGNVKRQVLDIFQKKAKPNGIFTKVIRFWNDAENIYKGFTHREMLADVLKRPYGGFRLEGIIKVAPTCNEAGYWITPSGEIWQTDGGLNWGI